MMILLKYCSILSFTKVCFFPKVDDYSMLEDLFRRGRIESDPFSDNVVSTNISEQLSDHDEPRELMKCLLKVFIK